MKKRLQGFIAGTISGIILTSGIAIAANTTTLYVAEGTSRDGTASLSITTD